MPENSYAVLGVAPGATDDVIRKAYAEILNAIRHGSLPPQSAQARIQAARIAYKSLSGTAATPSPISVGNAKPSAERKTVEKNKVVTASGAAAARPRWIAQSLILIGILIGLAVISSRLFDPGEDARQEQAFSQALEFVAKGQHQISSDMKNLQSSAAQMSQAEVAAALNRDIAPQWDRMYDWVVSAQLSEQSKQYPLRQAMLRFLDDHRKMTRLIADGIEQNNHALLAQANDLRDDADSQGAQIKNLIAD